MYTSVNYKTKKALKQAVKDGVQVRIYEPGFLGVSGRGTQYVAKAGRFFLEGPHYPEPHRWYATVVTNEHGHVISVK